MMRSVLFALLTALALAGPSAVRAEAVSPASLESKRAALNSLRKVVADIRAQVTKLTDRLAGEYIAYVRGAGKILDEQGISKTLHKEVFLAQQQDTYVNASLAAFDSFAARMRSRAPGPMASPLSILLTVERARLEDFLIANPLTVLEVIRTSGGSPPARVMELVEDTVAASDFTDLLRRAAPRGDAALRRRVAKSITRTASVITNQMADSYVSFLIKLTGELDKSGVTDTDARLLLLSSQRRKLSDPMLKEYDRFAAATQKTFAKTGAVIGPAASSALAAERELINRMFDYDPTILVRIAVDPANPGAPVLAGRTILRETRLGK